MLGTLSALIEEPLIVPSAGALCRGRVVSHPAYSPDQGIPTMSEPSMGHSSCTSKKSPRGGWWDVSRLGEMAWV